ncbi:hypothetical protein QBC47DRAFT_388033 [Echria macrotheca]|uniref:DUF1993 domain-containing protein n=1 Tax=Echria macrotheca TaxID=438768 RepID=A0AAJ0B819_9PEZI|nr:hypothetical protein QBC47DRAFT_388033 [Echria macrotheca]
MSTPSTTSLTLYNTTINIYIRSFNLLHTLLTQAQSHLPASSISSLPSARLTPDMYPLHSQIIIASNTALLFASRVAPHLFASSPFEPQDHLNPSTTLADLFSVVDKTLTTLRAIRPDDLEVGTSGADDDDDETKMMEIMIGGDTPFRSNAVGMAMGVALPNIFFHVVTAYGILRREGVPLGKKVYLGPFLEGNNIPKQEEKA